MNIYITYLLAIYVSFLLLCFIGAAQKDSIVGGYYKTRKTWRISINNIFLFVSFVLLFTLIGFRGDNIGSDTATYRRNFPLYAALNWEGIFTNNTNYEIGYRALMKIAANISSDPAWIIIVTSAIFMIFSFIFIKSNCRDYFFAVILFISVGPYLFAFNGIRQSLAGAFCLVGWTMYQRRDLFKAFLLFALAVLFHTTAVIFPILLIVLHFLPHNKKWYFIMLSGCLLFVAILRPAMNMILRFFPVYNLRYGHGRWTIVGVRGMIFVWVLIIALCIYECVKTNWKDVINRRKFEVLIFSTLYITFNLAGLLFDGLQRVPVFFSPFLILLFEDTFKFFEGRSRKIYRFTLILAFSVLFIRSAAVPQYADYRFFWEG